VHKVRATGQGAGRRMSRAVSYAVCCAIDARASSLVRLTAHPIYNTYGSHCQCGGGGTLSKTCLCVTYNPSPPGTTTHTPQHTPQETHHPLYHTRFKDAQAPPPPHTPPTNTHPTYRGEVDTSHGWQWWCRGLPRHGRHHQGLPLQACPRSSKG
jgi:hypothetical protein